MHQSSQIAPAFSPLRLFFKGNVIHYGKAFIFVLSELLLICFEMHCIYLYCKLFLQLQILSMRHKTTVFSFAMFSILKKKINTRTSVRLITLKNGLNYFLRTSFPFSLSIPQSQLNVWLRCKCLECSIVSVPTFTS